MKPVLSAGLAAALALAAAAGEASTVIGLSIEDQARLSSMVVAGTVLAQQGVDDPSRGLETAVVLEVDDVLKGGVKPGEVVVFHLRGGELDGEVSVAVGEAQLKTGQRALVFVETVDGRPYLLGLSLGAWSVREDAAGTTLYTRALQDGLEVVGDETVETGPLTAGEMRARVAWAVANPKIESALLRDALLPTKAVKP